MPVATTWNDSVSPAAKVAELRLVIAGGTFTVSVAAEVVASLPTALVKIARYCLALSPAAAVKLRVVEVAPEMSAQSTPPLVLTCHLTVGVGVPLAAAVNVAVLPLTTVWLEGLCVIAGAIAGTNSTELAV